MRYFSENDFNHATPSCSIDDMDRDFLLRLYAARHISGEAFIINSAFRSEEHELAQGRSGKSSHTKGIAVDIRASSSRSKFNIVKALLEVGFTRMGIYKTFIHVDCDEDKENHVMWQFGDDGLDQTTREELGAADAASAAYTDAYTDAYVADASRQKTLKQCADICRETLTKYILL